MPVTIEQDLKEVLAQINSKLDNVQKDVNTLTVDLAIVKGEIKSLNEKLSGEIKTLDEKLSGEIKTLDEKLSGEIKTLDTKIDGINKRLDFQEFINRSVLGGVVVAIIIGLVKFLGFMPNP